MQIRKLLFYPCECDGHQLCVCVYMRPQEHHGTLCHNPNLNIRNRKFEKETNNRTNEEK